MATDPVTEATSGDSDGGAVHADPPSVPPAKPTRRAIALFGACAFAVLALDILSKQLVVAHLTDGEPVKVVPHVLYLTLTRNSGAAFSMGSSVTWVFPTIALVVIGVIVHLARTVRSAAWAVALGLVLGGAVGNLLDRLFRAPGPFRGHVVDFISAFSPTGSGFAIFNLADSALVCGVILAVLLELTGRHRNGTRVRH